MKLTFCYSELIYRQMDYKILERNGKFLVGVMEMKRKWFWSTPYEEFRCIWKGSYKPAHFMTIEEAREHVKKISKPDTYHSL